MLKSQYIKKLLLRTILNKKGNSHRIFTYWYEPVFYTALQVAVN